MEEKIFNISDENKGLRIDKFIAEQFQEKSRSYLQGMIDDGYVLVNDKQVKSNYKLRTGDILKTTIKEPVELEVKKENIPLDIIYEDSDIIVVNKERGMVVHPAPGNYEGTLVNALLYHCTDLSSINGVIRPGIVHRIDKDTTGVLVVAKNDEAHVKLSEQLKNHSMKREYYALVEGRLKRDSGTIDRPLKRSKKDRLKIAIVEDGKRAVTHYEVIERFKNATLVRCILETGRTHQIRVHMSSIGYPLIGDPLYGYKKHKFKDDGQMLHAKVLGLVHPSTGEYMEFSSELPKNYVALLENLRRDNI
ncbi:RluA family pseudouridine synthase [uncultured Clostridium sp.]|uniref:RluA family pseudouridine synthase n=1 Tax=uncultured Clostridium sp. TaxID=59620 RepID=UPI0026174C05|nr:RluA family pseudouridine synthase [uncultured Clostridium sp.]